MGIGGKIIGALIGGVFGLLASVVLLPAAAAFHDSEGASAATWLMLVPLLLGLLLGYMAPSIRRVFGRGFLLLGVAVLALPISAMLLSGRAFNEVVGKAEGGEAAAAIGAGLAGAAVTGVATFVGLIVGAILIIVGLVLALGGRREIVVVNR